MGLKNEFMHIVNSRMLTCSFKFMRSLTKTNLKYMTTFPYLIFFMLLNFFLSSFATAGQSIDTNTITVFNNSPIVNLVALSRPDFATQKPPKSFTFRAQYEITNYISSTAKNADVLFIDGETLTLRHSISYQFNPGLQLAISIPWIKHSGGMADQFIYNFHDILQLPQNGRTEANEDDIRWRLIHEGQTLLSVQDTLSGWGDISITAQLTPPDSPSVRWSFMTKLPTGDFEEQTGSGKLDLGLSFSEMNPQWFKQRKLLAETDLALWYGAGINYLGKIKQLRALDQAPLVATFRTGAAYAPLESWQLKLQLDSQSPLFDTEIRELGWFPLMLSFASSHQFGSDSILELVITEDLRPRSAPDVIFQTTYQTTF